MTFHVPTLRSSSRERRHPLFIDSVATNDTVLWMTIASVRYRISAFYHPLRPSTGSESVNHYGKSEDTEGSVEIFRILSHHHESWTFIVRIPRNSFLFAEDRRISWAICAGSLWYSSGDSSKRESVPVDTSSTFWSSEGTFFADSTVRKLEAEVCQ